MITPIMISNIGWGTYCFFFAVNTLFIPIIYFLYPETRKRSLEEIDIIFAKGHSEKMSYVRAAKELPLMDEDEIERMTIFYGLIEESGRGGSVSSTGMPREVFETGDVEKKAGSGATAEKVAGDDSS